MNSYEEDRYAAAALEAMLFVSDEPVASERLARMLTKTPSEVHRILKEVSKKYEDECRGIQLREVAGGWCLSTHPAYHELLERYIVSWDTRKLSQAALETLAIIAYLQPITRATVSDIRGVNSDSSVSSLVEKGLVREAGTSSAPGNPLLYATTKRFLERFGLKSCAELPDIEDFAPDDKAKDLIRERLLSTPSSCHDQGNASMHQQVLPKDSNDMLDSFHFDQDDEVRFTIATIPTDDE